MSDEIREVHTGNKFAIYRNPEDDEPAAHALITAREVGNMGTAKATVICTMQLKPDSGKTAHRKTEATILEYVRAGRWRRIAKKATKL